MSKAIWLLAAGGWLCASTLAQADEKPSPEPIPLPKVELPADSKTPSPPTPAAVAAAEPVQTAAPACCSTGRCGVVRHDGSCLQAIKEWLCYKPAQTSCCRSHCSGCCGAPLYTYFL